MRRSLASLNAAILFGWAAFVCQVEAIAVELEVAPVGAAEFRPYRGLTYTKEGIEQVREVARSTSRGQAMAAAVFETAEQWLAFSPAEIEALVPSPDSVFAMGYSGDPKSGNPWPAHARGDVMCRLDRPGEVRSPDTGDVYGIQKPGEEFYDDGSGWKRPGDGQVFYFVGVWNAWLVDRMLSSIDDMALAYMLSGEERVAERALQMLDALATLRANRPADRGPVDWPTPYQQRREDYGFLVFAGNGANSRMYQTLLALDLLAASPNARSTSPTAPALTVLENIRENFVGSFETFYKETLHTFYNHLLVLYANEIAQGVLFGDAELLREGIEAVYGFLDNAINRDGEYFENAAGYNEVGVNYAAQMIVPLSNYDPSNYPNAAELPDPADYPFAMRFANDPRWISAAVLMQYRPIILGRRIQYGDYYADRRVEARLLDASVALRRAVYLRLLAQDTTDPDWRERFEHLFLELPDEARVNSGLHYVRLLGMSQWLNPSSPTSAREDLLADIPDGSDSDMLGARGIGILRSGKGPERRAVFMRGGVNNVHGHDDQMGLILYARGMSLTGLYGYRFAGMPDHWGWGTRSIAHNMVVVDQDLPAISPYKRGPAADVLAFVPKKDSGSVQLMEMSGSQQWRGVDEYRRAVWQVDVSDEQFYFLDLFRVSGGKTHDYAWTGPYPRSGPAANAFSISGVSPQPVAGVWTLAGFDSRYADASYNQSGQSWGERILVNTGTIKDLGIPDEVVNNVSRWSPPPGNGYGFIWNVKSAVTESSWAARWNLLDGKSQMRLTMLNPDGQQVITGSSPALSQDRHHALVVARRESVGGEKLRSRYVSLTEVADGDEWPILESAWVDPITTGDPKDAAALTLRLRDGRQDVIVTNTGARMVSAAGVDLQGERGFARFGSDGKVDELLLQEGTALRAGGVLIQADQDAWRGQVTAVEGTDGINQVKLDTRLPEDLLTREILFERSGYVHNEFYRIYGIQDDPEGSVIDFGLQSVVGARLTVTGVQSDGNIGLRWPNEVGGHFQAGYFRGRQLVSLEDDSVRGEVAEFTGARTMKVSDPQAIREGDRLAVRMVQPGDRFSIPTRVTLRRERVNQWAVQTNQDLLLIFPAEPDQHLLLVTDKGEARTIGISAGTSVTAVLPLEWTSGGRAVLRLCGSSDFACGGTSAGLAFEETFASYAMGESIIGPDWEMHGAAELSNSAVVQAGSYVTVTSQGNARGIHGRVVSRRITNHVPRQITDTDFNHVEVDMRWVSPGSSSEIGTNVYLSLSGGSHFLNMGFLAESGEKAFFFDFGTGNRTKLPWSSAMDEERWYRFVVDLIPSTGDFSFEVIDLVANKTVWRGTKRSEGLNPFFPVEWRALVLVVSNPGPSGSLVQSADFDNIWLPGSIPGVDQPVGAELRRVIVVDFETVEGRYYQIETSNDQQNWVPEGNILIGDGFPVYRVFAADEEKPRFFRVVTE